ncbi:hypothetical protein FQA39_LY13248 [Lamprigera yunnana]|nr:hypothetical protein FQA39_LY13248 [Lamprigera yunnana]
MDLDPLAIDETPSQLLSEEQIDQVCRTCLSDDSNLQSIFQTNLDEMIMGCTSLKVYNGDGLPSQICSNCVILINQAYKFKRQAENSDYTFRQFYLHKGTEESMTECSIDNFTEEMVKTEIMDSETINDTLNTEEDGNMSDAGESSKCNATKEDANVTEVEENSKCSRVAQGKVNKTKDSDPLSLSDVEEFRKGQVNSSTWYSSDDDSGDDVHRPPKKIKTTDRTTKYYSHTSPHLIKRFSNTIDQPKHTLVHRKKLDNSMEKFQRIVLRRLGIQQLAHRESQKQFEILRGMLKHLNDVLIPENTSDSDEVEIVWLRHAPFKCQDELDEFEELLVDPLKTTKIINHFKAIGGQNLESAIKRIMRLLISNEVAQNYSWTGARGKKPFMTLKLADVIFKSIRQQKKFQEATQVEMTSAIQKWLVRAKERAMNTVRKNSNHQAEISFKKEDPSIQIKQM